MPENPLKVTVSELKFENIGDIYNLGNKLFTAGRWLNLYRTWDEYEIIERYISDRKYCLVAKIGKEVVGFTLGALVEKKKNSWLYGYILWLGVAPQYTGKGIAKKLLRKLVRIFKSDGVKIILADTSLENKIALSFFHRNGFIEEEGHVFLAKNIARH